MIACYIRVSTTSQNSDGQKLDVRRWLKGQGYKAKDVQWFEDKETGKHTDRPAFQKMQQSVFMGELKRSLSGDLIGCHAINVTASIRSPIGARKVFAS